MKNVFLITISLLFCLKSMASTWLVGPTKTYKKPSQVASLVASGDSVLIDPGIYESDVCTWFDDDLTLIGASPSQLSHLKSNGAAAGGKAIWVIKGKGVRVENIEFSGCKVPDQNGAGIRAEGLSLVVEHCYFHHNEMGILTNNDPTAEVTIEHSQFEDNGFGDGYSHNVYVGSVKKLIFRFNFSRRSTVGHLLKSRAATNHIFFNRLTGEGGPVSREIDLPNGGTALIVGNLIQQAADGKNGNIIGYGLEGLSAPMPHELFLVNNTIVNERFAGSFLQVQNGTAFVKMVANFLVGPGSEVVGSPVLLEKHDNATAPDTAAAFFQNSATQDYQLKSGSPAIDAGASAGFAGSISLDPMLTYLHPLGSESRVQSGGAVDAGAYEFAQPLAIKTIFEKEKKGISVVILSENNWLVSSETGGSAQVFDSKGSLVAHFSLEKGETIFDASRLGAGIYFLFVEAKNGATGSFRIFKME